MLDCLLRAATQLVDVRRDQRLDCSGESLRCVRRCHSSRFTRIHRLFNDPGERLLQKLLPLLPPGSAAIVAFIIATSAEWATIERVLRVDVADDFTTCRLRGSKNSRRDRIVPIVTDEQQALLRYAMLHADGVGELLFQPWSNVRRNLRAACTTCDIEPVSPNDLRRTFATWLRMSGVAPNLIAPMMGHADSRMVERVYGQLSPSDLGRLVNQAVYGDTRPNTTAGPVPGTGSHSVDSMHSVTQWTRAPRPLTKKPR